jgi:hypothetical protein
MTESVFVVFRRYRTTREAFAAELSGVLVLIAKLKTIISSTTSNLKIIQIPGVCPAQRILASG